MSLKDFFFSLIIGDRVYKILMSDLLVDFYVENDINTLNEVSTILPEIFFGISLIFLVLHGILISSSKKKKIFHLFKCLL